MSEAREERFFGVFENSKWLAVWVFFILVRRRTDYKNRANMNFAIFRENSQIS